ncbi:efflux RND transporter periplasmic adaptor subunit, partial [Nodosilinea sp. LEGE 07298]|uniref:efflux RND transporter periplasmic adaptor subunit n=1 Tax=Nodosilinea sp. LEGE 07298 TaxID=2777970 RepID=UPI00187E3D22
MSDHSLSEENLDSAVQASPFNSAKRFLDRQPRWLIGLGAAGLLLTAGAPIVYSQMAASDEPAEEALAEPLAVETLIVDAVNSYEVLRAYTGEIAALRSSDLGFNRGGELVQVLVSEGDRVSSGQVLAQLDTQNLQTQRRQLEAQKAEAQARLLELERGARQEDIAAASAEVRDIESQLRLQEQQRSRREYLYEQGAISKEQLDEFAYGADTLQARLDRANSNLSELLNGTRPEQVAAQRAVVQQLDASLADVDVNLSKSTLKAPFEGIVAGQTVDEGVVVGAGQSVVRLVENEAPEARIGIPENAASQLQAGNAVTVTLGTERYSATVKSVLPEVDPDTRTQIVVFQIEPTAIARLNPGQTARVELTETIPTGGIWLPTQALAQDIRGLWSVYVVMPAKDEIESETEGEDNVYQVQPKAVEILHQESDRALVQGTLQAGDRIISSGVHRLVPGQYVRPL